MKRIIEVKVNGDYLTKDSDQAGTQHEANATILRITFDESWDSYAKSVTFWDARGLNPVTRNLTVDLLEDITKDTRIYLCPIPGEPLALDGKFQFVIEGYVGGKRQRAVGNILKSRPAPRVADDVSPTDPTPTQAQQLQVQIEAVIEDIRRAIEAADTADTAKARAMEALEVAEEIREMLSTGAHASRHAADGDDPLTPAMIGAATPEQVSAAQQAAEAAATAAHTAANAAQSTANGAQSAASAAHTAANNAQGTANAAATAAANADANANARLSIYGGTVNGRIKAHGFEVTDYAQPLEAPQHIDYHIAGSTADYDARLSIDSNKELWYERYGIGSGRVIHEGMVAKSTVDIGEGVAMVPGGFYIVYQ